jgi:hypothetical protein
MLMAYEYASVHNGPETRSVGQDYSKETPVQKWCCLREHVFYLGWPYNFIPLIRQPYGTSAYLLPQSRLSSLLAHRYPNRPKRIYHSAMVSAP